MQNEHMYVKWIETKSKSLLSSSPVESFNPEPRLASHTI